MKATNWQSIFLTKERNRQEGNKKIFDKFYRIPKGDTQNVKGFGLGLFYVRQIAQAHQWNLKVESEPGVGTTFYITIDQK
ncbi:MAG: ATP-binding protein [Saprospiraceae bacterium]|nr:ATP-binding protein [Saprospiraceae bacterium]